MTSSPASPLMWAAAPAGSSGAGSGSSDAGSGIPVLPNAVQPAPDHSLPDGNRTQARHAPLLADFDKQLALKRASWDSSGAIVMTLLLMATEALLIYHVAPAGACGSKPWAAAVVGMELAEAALLLTPTAIQRCYLPDRAYLRCRTALVLATRVLALGVVGARTEFAWDAIADSFSADGGLSGGMLMMVHGLRLLLTSHLHQLGLWPASLLQLMAVVGVVFRSVDACTTWPPFQHPASLQLFETAVKRLNDYASVVGGAVGVPGTRILSVEPPAGAAACTQASFCFPVLLWIQAVFTLALPLGYQMCREMLARHQYMQRHCRCPRCASPCCLSASSIVLVTLHAPALIWQVVAICWSRWTNNLR